MCECERDARACRSLSHSHKLHKTPSHSHVVQSATESFSPSVPGDSRLIRRGAGALTLTLTSSGTWHMAHGTWHMAHGIWHMAHGTWHMAHGTWHTHSPCACPTHTPPLLPCHMPSYALLLISPPPRPLTSCTSPLPSAPHPLISFIPPSSSSSPTLSTFFASFYLHLLCFPTYLICNGSVTFPTLHRRI